MSCSLPSHVVLLKQLTNKDKRIRDLETEVKNLQVQVEALEIQLKNCIRSVPAKEEIEIIDFKELEKPFEQNFKANDHDKKNVLMEELQDLRNVNQHLVKQVEKLSEASKMHVKEMAKKDRQIRDLANEITCLQERVHASKI